MIENDEIKTDFRGYINGCYFCHMYCVISLEDKLTIYNLMRIDHGRNVYNQPIESKGGILTK